MSTNTERVPIETTAKMKEMMMLYMMRAKMAEDNPDQKIAWITSGGPVEILQSAGVIPIYPENHAAMCGSMRVSDDLAHVAELAGYSQDLCSYARTDFGSILSGKSPMGGSPRPDFLVCCNNICGTVTKWYQELQRMFEVPLIFIDAPFQYEDRDHPEAIQYLRDQLVDVMQQVGDITGTPFDMDRFEETMQLSEQAIQLWKEIQDLLAHKPAPMNSFDTFIHMGPIVTLRGTQECVDYYRALKVEIEERVSTGIAAVPGEKYRLGWDNLAIWFKVKFLSQAFAEGGAALVASTYPMNFCYQAPSRRDGDRLWNLAADYIAGYINHGLEYREQDLVKMARDFHLDGFVLHSNRSCRAYSLGQYDLVKALEQKHGLPTLLLEADQCDTRTWSDEQMSTRIGAFLETLAGR